MSKIILRDKVYIPEDSVDMEAVEKNYSKKVYDESACRRCEYKPDRHSYMCDNCESFKEHVVLFSRKTLGGVDYVALPLGDRKNIQRKASVDFSDFKIVDKRTVSPLEYNVKFKLQLRPHQVKLEEDFLNHKYGIIEAPPRTGKTATMLSICLKLGQRTLFLASQHEFLTQIQDHVHGNEAEGIPRCTNLPYLEKKYAKKLYGFPKTDEDFENFQIMFMTYQSLIHESGIRRIHLLNANVGTVAIDEIHKASASTFAATVSKLKCKYKLGCTGTVERKDGKHWIMAAIVGPVTATTSIEALTPKVVIHTTPITGRRFGTGKASWMKVMKYLSEDEQRNKHIVSKVCNDLRNGYNIVIPVIFKAHVFELQRMINDAFGSDICGTFVGGGSKKNKEGRKELLTAAKLGDIRVIVGIRSLLQLSLNVPAWSAIYEIIPINNKPNLQQETKRVCTPKEGKNDPIIRLFVDLNQAQSVSCAKHTIRHMRQFKYIFSADTSEKQLIIYNRVHGKSTGVQYRPSARSLFSQD